MKPIRVVYSPLSDRFFATRSYQIKGNVLIITGQKDDVTQDIARAVVENEVEFSVVKDEPGGDIDSVVCKDEPT